MSACKEKRLGAGEQGCGALRQMAPGHLSTPAQETWHTARGLHQDVAHPESTEVRGTKLIL